MAPKRATSDHRAHAAGLRIVPRSSPSLRARRNPAAALCDSAPDCFFGEAAVPARARSLQRRSAACSTLGISPSSQGPLPGAPTLARIGLYRPASRSCRGATRACERSQPGGVGVSAAPRAGQSAVAGCEAESCAMSGPRARPPPSLGPGRSPAASDHVGPLLRHRDRGADRPNLTAGVRPAAGVIESLTTSCAVDLSLSPISVG